MYSAATDAAPGYSAVDVHVLYELDYFKALVSDFQDVLELQYKHQMGF